MRNLLRMCIGCVLLDPRVRETERGWIEKERRQMQKVFDTNAGVQILFAQCKHVHTTRAALQHPFSCDATSDYSATTGMF